MSSSSLLLQEPFTATTSQEATEPAEANEGRGNPDRGVTVAVGRNIMGKREEREDGEEEGVGEGGEGGRGKVTEVSVVQKFDYIDDDDDEFAWDDRDN